MTIPQKLGKYEIRRELGSGAMGIVYEGWDPGIARRVAIKTVKHDQLDRAEAGEILTRFQREAQAAGRLSHPNIVSIYEFGEEADGTSFIAMEFIEGRELKDYFDANERFPLTEIERIMEQLLAALGHAHQHGIVHRDIKPANIILVKDGQVKVADFGIARIESSNLTQAGTVLGTPSYMSPEQFMGQTVDGRSDLFSAGVILYQFLTGEKPFTGTLTTIMHKVLKEDPLSPSELNVQVPRPFDALIRQAMAKRPDDRFQTARAFASAITVAMQNKTVTAMDVTLAGCEDATVIAGAESTMVTQSLPSHATTTPIGSISDVEQSPSAAPSVVNPKKKIPKLAIVTLAATLMIGVGVIVMRGGGTGSAVDGMTAPVSPSTPPPAQTNETLNITAVGYVDPTDPRFAQDQGLMQAELREDMRRQLIEKAAALFIDQNSLAQNYGLIQAKLLANSGNFIQSVREEQVPQQGKDGLLSLTAKATVNIRQVQKSLNQMSRDERVDFIRNNGDPRISVLVNIKSAEASLDAPAQPSPLAENLLKERIQSFGFRPVNNGGADFAVTGEAKFDKRQATLEASGITITKYVLTSWTVKCVDRKTGEEIYYNTQIPEKKSWATEDQALGEVGQLIGEEFSKNFFLRHFHQTSQKIVLKLRGVPNKETAESLLREFTGMRSVLSINQPMTLGGDIRFDTEISGGLADPADLVAKGLVSPLNQKLGKTCLNVAGKNGSDVTITFEPSCAAPETLGRLENLPPAALLTAPASRLEAVIRNQAKLKKLTI